MSSKTSQNVIYFLSFAVVAVLVYSPGLGIPYYGDDFQFVFDESVPVYSHFYRNNPENGFYRPIQAMFLSLVQRGWGLNTAPVQAVQVFLHLLLSYLVFVTVRRLGFTRTQAVLGSLFLLVSQANVHAVLSNDTLSQAGGTLFGYLAVGLALLYTRGSRTTKNAAGGRRYVYYASLLALAFSYFSKESSTAFFAMVLTVFAIGSPLQRRTAAVKTFLGRAFPLVLLTVFYLVVRSVVAGAQPEFGSGKYDFNLGTNVVVNLAMCLFAASVPASSVDAFVAMKTGNIVLVSIYAGLTVLFLLVTAAGLSLSRHSYKPLVMFAGFSLIGFFPMVLMNHVSELYVYNSMPFISVLVGVGLGRCLETARKYMAGYIFAGLTIVALFISHTVAVKDKAVMMKECGERAAVLLKGIEPHVDKVPEDGRLLLVNPPGGGVEYSVFLINGFNVLTNGLHRINDVSSRYDFETHIVERDRVEKEGAAGETYAITTSRSKEWAVKEYHTTAAPFLVVLGIAQDGGYPQAGCKKPCCASVWENHGKWRHVSCVAVVDPAASQRWIIDATPDFKAQLRMLDGVFPVSDTPGIDGIFLTHGHAGHYPGLIHLGREVMGTKGIPVYAMPRMFGFLGENGPWDQLVRLQNISLRPLRDGVAVRLNDRISITPFLVPHRDEYTETVGYRIDGPDRSAVYISDIDKWDRWDKSIAGLISDVSVAFLDGTFYADGEIPGRNMADIPHPLITESMSLFESLSAADKAKVHFIHLNHTNPALITGSDARDNVRKNGFFIAVEKQKFDL